MPESRAGKGNMNYVLYIRNQKGFVTSAGYTHKTEEQIDAIIKSWQKQGLEIVKMRRRND